MAWLLAILLLIFLYYYLGRSTPNRENGRYYYVRTQWIRHGQLRPVTVQIPMQEMNRLRARCRDRKTAERLVFQAVAQYPGQTGRWYVEKALYALERDRH